MKIKRFNEAITDKMVGKSEEDIDQAIKNIFDKMSPFSAMAYIMTHNLEDYEKIVWGEIKKEIKVLDNIFEKYTYEYSSLNDLVKDVADWVEKNDGDRSNITINGFDDLVKSINKYEFPDADLIKLFKDFLKTMALSEVNSNNKYIKLW